MPLFTMIMTPCDCLNPKHTVVSHSVTYVITMDIHMPYNSCYSNKNVWSQIKCGQDDKTQLPVTVSN